MKRRFGRIIPSSIDNRETDVKRFIIALSFMLFNAHAYADVGVSVSIGEPGFYGRLDMNNFPQPQLIYSQPMTIGPVPMGRPPIYLRVPPGYAKNWRRHCHEYNACREHVYFVRDSWYRYQYAPRYRRDEDRFDRRDEGRDHRDGDRGRGEGDHRGFGRD